MLRAAATSTFYSFRALRARNGFTLCN